MRTSVISDVNHDVRDPGCFELFDRTNGFLYEREEVCCFGAEGADKKLAIKKILSSGNAKAAGTRTTPVLFPGKMYDLMITALPFTGDSVGKYFSGRATAIFC